MKTTLLLITFLLAASAFAGQTVYRWIGPDGKVVYGDRPPAEVKVDKKLKFDHLPSSALPAQTLSSVEQLKRSRASAPPKTSAVVLYSASWCGYCKAAKAYLGARGIAYQEIDVDTAAGQIAYAQAGGGNGVPLLIAGDQRVQGFSLAAYEAIFSGRR